MESRGKFYLVDLILIFAQAGKSKLQEAADPYYTLEVSELSYDRAYTIQVTSYVERANDYCNGWFSCAKYGTRANLTFKYDGE